MNNVGSQALDLGESCLPIEEVDEIESKKLSTKDHIKLLERVFAYVVSTPEEHIKEKTKNKTDKWKWVYGFNPDILSLSAKRSLDKTGKIPSTILYVLLDMVERSRSDIEDVFKEDTVVDNDPRKDILDILDLESMPIDDTEISDKKWLSERVSKMVKKSRGKLSRKDAKNKIVNQGIKAVKKVLVALFKEKRPMTEEEKEGVRNMAQTIESAEVIKVLMPFAIQDPSIGAYLLNNLSLVRPGEESDQISREFNFRPIIDNSLFAAEDDVGIAMELAKTLSNEYTDEVIPDVEFSDIIRRIVRNPLYYPNMTIALLRHIDLDSIHDIVMDIVKRYAQDGFRDECDLVLSEVSACLSERVHEMVERAYEYYKVLNSSSVPTQGSAFYNDKFPEAKKNVETMVDIVGLMNIIDHDGLSESILTKVDKGLKALDHLFDRGSVVCLRSYYKDIQNIVKKVDEPLPPGTVVGGNGDKNDKPKDDTKKKHQKGGRRRKNGKQKRNPKQSKKAGRRKGGRPAQPRSVRKAKKAKRKELSDRY